MAHSLRERTVHHGREVNLGRSPSGNIFRVTPRSTVTMVILNPVKLTMKINHHGFVNKCTTLRWALGPKPAATLMLQPAEKQDYEHGAPPCLA